MNKLALLFFNLFLNQNRPGPDDIVVVTSIAASPLQLAVTFDPGFIQLSVLMND